MSEAHLLQILHGVREGTIHTALASANLLQGDKERPGKRPDESCKDGSACRTCATQGLKRTLKGSLRGQGDVDETLRGQQQQQQQQ